jgi:hypothetical protein
MTCSACCTETSRLSSHLARSQRRPHSDRRKRIRLWWSAATIQQCWTLPVEDGISPRPRREALTEMNRDPNGPWLSLREDEQPPEVEVDQPDLVIWSSIWASCPDARVRLDLAAEGHGTALRGTLLVDAPLPEPARLRHMGKRLNQLSNADLRYTFVQ